MWQDRQARLLKDEIEAILSSLANEANFYHLTKEVITKVVDRSTGKTRGDKPWPLVPLIVCESILGRYKHVLPAAAALELFKAAAEVFDDTEDTDSSISISAKYGAAVATNIATTLLILAEKAITRLEKKGVDSSLVFHVMDVINSLCITACTGQHLDLFPSSEKISSEDRYLRIAGMRSATQLECACHVGALLANADRELTSTFALFGHNLGMASQIANDIHGITSGRDINKRKLTLPVIYALSHANEEARNQLELIYSTTPTSLIDLSQIRDLLFSTGSIYYASIKMELFKQQALDVLSKIENTIGNVERLQLFLE